MSNQHIHVDHCPSRVDATRLVCTDTSGANPVTVIAGGDGHHSWRSRREDNGGYLDRCSECTETRTSRS